MRTMLRRIGVVGLVAVGAVAWWRQNRRFGAGWVNRVVDPWLVRAGAIDGSRGELGLLEHVGRRSGTVRVTPIHPVRTEGGFRIIAPIGVESEWARNVLAAGHCRLQVGTLIHELDEPRMVMPTEIDGLPRPMAQLMDWLGFRYLVLRQFAEHVGTLDEGPAIATPTSAPAPLEPVPAA